MKPTQEQALDWAFECDFVESTPAEDVFSSIYVCCPKDIERLVTLAYEAGRKDENEALTEGLEGIEFIGHRSLQLIYVTRTSADKARAAIRARRKQ